jgi:hypothetical protein
MNIPILLLTYNRTDTLANVLEAIKKYRPKKLYVVADGPNKYKTDDEEKCKAVRELIDSFNKKQDIIKRYRDSNYGCKQSVEEGISWFFENEDKGIILEDDTLPDQSFFMFCEELLNKYQHKSNIFAIGGTSLLNDFNNYTPDYYFSIQGSIWGWATWKRAWINYIPKITTDNLNENINRIKTNSPSKYIYEERIKIFERLIENQIDSWGYHWLYSRIISDGLTILPKRNLVSNIGFSKTATHTNMVNHPLANLKHYSIIGPLKHPSIIIVNTKNEKKICEKIYSSKKISLFNRIKKKLKNIILGK